MDSKQIGRWKRSGNGLAWTVREDLVPLSVVRCWKELLAADSNLAHVVTERRAGAEWATGDILDSARTNATRAADNWKTCCRAMGWNAPNGRTYSVHVEPAPAN